MAYSSDFLANLRRANLGVIVSREIPTKRDGEGVRAKCCFHDGTSADSLAVFRDNQTQEWAFFCHSNCGAGGSIIDWFMKRRGLDFFGAVEAAAEATGIPIEETRSNRADSPEDLARRKRQELLAAIVDIGARQAGQEREAKLPIVPFAGITALAESLRKLGFTDEDFRSVGMDGRLKGTAWFSPGKLMFSQNRSGITAMVPVTNGPEPAIGIAGPNSGGFAVPSGPRVIEGAGWFPVAATSSAAVDCWNAGVPAYVQVGTPARYEVDGILRAGADPIIITTPDDPPGAALRAALPLLAGAPRTRIVDADPLDGPTYRLALDGALLVVERELGLAERLGVLSSAEGLERTGRHLRRIFEALDRARFPFEYELFKREASKVLQAAAERIGVQPKSRRPTTA